MSDELGANIMLNEKTNSTYCTADLWRIAQQSRSVYLGFWLRSLFQKLRPRSLKTVGPRRSA